MLRSYLSVFLCFFLVACDDSDSSNGEAPVAGESMSDASMNDASMSDAGVEETVSIRYTARNAQTDEVITNAEICVDGRECVTADEEGVVVLDFAVGSRVGISAKAAGYTTARGIGIVPETDLTEYSLPLILEGVVSLLGTKAGVDNLDAEKGHIAFLAVYPGDEVEGEKDGVSMTIEPAGDGVGPKYVKEGDVIELLAGDLYDDTLTATTSSGAANYFNVTPGTYTLSLTGAEGCESFFGIQNDDGTIEFDIKANEMTYLLIACEQE